jgi:predicted kinase
VARLVLLNGLPGSGKSTLARRYVDDRPLALALDVDVVRSMLGRWLEQPGPAGLAARALALAMARVHLGAGHDVVVPQLLARDGFVRELEGVAHEAGVPFLEVLLQVSVDEATQRLARRAGEVARPEHRDAAALLERRGGGQEVARLHAGLEQVVAGRAHTLTVPSVPGQVEQTYHALLAALARAEAQR